MYYLPRKDFYARRKVGNQGSALHIGKEKRGSEREPAIRCTLVHLNWNNSTETGSPHSIVRRPELFGQR